MTFALTVIAVGVGAYVAILSLLWRFQERIVSQPPRNPQPREPASSTLTYTSADGIALLAYVVATPHSTGKVVLAFHGNAMISRWMIPWARDLARRTGASVVIPEFRGYDGLSGVPTYEGAGLDAAAAVAATCEHFRLESSELVYYGHSLGTAIATELASTYPPRALVLESPFTSARDMAARWPIAGIGQFWGLISRVHYRTLDRVMELGVPVYVAHGERDVIIPARMGREVHAAARQKGALLLVPGAGHNDVAEVGGDAYWHWIEGAVRMAAH